MSGTELQILTDVERRLAAISTVAEAKELRDQAEALRHYAKSARQGLALQNRVARVKFGAERRAGELLLEMPRIRNRRRGGAGISLRLKEIGISTETASKWQALARFPLAQLAALFQACEKKGEEIGGPQVWPAVKAWMESQHPAERREEPAEVRPAEPDAEAVLKLIGLLPKDLNGLAPTQVRVLVKEVQQAYADFCDEAQPKPERRGDYGPAVLLDWQRLRMWAERVIRDLEAGKIGHGSIRQRLRVVEAWNIRKPAGNGKSGPTLTVRYLGPFEQYEQAVRRFIAEIRGLTVPRGLLDEHVNLLPSQRHAVRALGTKVRAALDVLDMALQDQTAAQETAERVVAP